MEGQARGIQRMTDEDRYCLDIVHQVQALTAAAREVSVIVLEDHLLSCLGHAVEELVKVLRTTLPP